MPHMKLIDGLPTVHVGRPEEDRHGLRTYPVLVVRQDGMWLAIGYAKQHRRWPLPEVDCGPVPSVEVRVALERTVQILIGDANRLVEADQNDAETIRALDAQADRLEKQAKKIRLDLEVIGQKREAVQSVGASRWH